MRRLLIACVLLSGPTALVGPALLPGRALLPADLLVQFEPWRSALAGEALPESQWDPLVWDGIAYFYPARKLLADSVRSGVIPLWNPYQFCGSPFLANAQSAVLYPPNLLFAILPVAYAFGWSAWFHLCATGWLMYLLLRRVGVGRLGALCGAVVWQLNSFTVAWLHLPVVLCSLAWLPGVLLMCELALRSGRQRFSVAAGAGLALSCLGGHPQMFLYLALMTAAYLAARGLSREAQSWALRPVRTAAAAAVCFTGAAGLAAGQALPSLELVGMSHRAVAIGPDTYRAYLARSLQPIQLLNLLLPHPFGHPALGTYFGPENYADYCLYVGLPALLIAAAAPFLSRTWHARFLAASALVALLVALGTPLNWPLYRWVPGMASAGGPARMVALCVFSLAGLVGIGLDRMVTLVGCRRSRVQWAAGLVVVVLAADLLAAARHHVHVTPVAWAYPTLELGELRGRGEGRLLTLAGEWPLRGRFPQAVFPPNAATVYHLREVGGYDALYLARFRDFAALLQGGDPSPQANGNMILFHPGPGLSREMGQLTAADTYLWPGPDGRTVVVHDQEALPRAWLARAAVSVPSHAEAVRAMAGRRTERGVVVVTGRAEPTASAPASDRATVRDLSPNAVEVELVGGGGYLFLADSFAPGWRAYMDGRLLRVMPANVAFRAVAVPSGARKVVFRYEPASFRVGMFVSLLSLALVMGVAACSWAMQTPRA